MLELLKIAQNDTDQIIATPNSLLASQPGLRRLKDGLIDSQLTAARLQGTRSAAHPRVAAALEAEATIRRNLHSELEAAIQSAEAELELNNTRYANAKQQLKVIEQRLTALAEQRAEYSNRVAAVETSRQTLSRVRDQLHTAQASLSASSGASVLTPLDAPETGPSRSGVGLATMVGAGTIAGLTLGLGLVLLSGGPLAGGFAAPSLTAQTMAQNEQPVPKREWWETNEEMRASAQSNSPVPGSPITVQERTTPSEAAPADSGYENAWEAPAEAKLPEAVVEPFAAEKTMILNTDDLPNAASGASRQAGDFAGMSLQDAMLAAGQSSK